MNGGDIDSVGDIALQKGLCNRIENSWMLRKYVSINRCNIVYDAAVESLFILSLEVMGQ